MVFSSISFLFFFLPALLIVYYCIPRRLREIRNTVLLIFSLFFYLWGGPKFLVVMLVSITVNYICGLFAGEGHSGTVRLISVITASAVGLGMLCWFKYSAFFAETVNGFGLSLPIPKVTLPIGISFFTFHGLSYIFDVYRDKAKPMKNPLRIALYISLFPQLVAGPIVRYSTVYGHLIDRDENLADFGGGAVRFVFGLAKKLVIANSMGAVADKIFAFPAGSLSVATAWIGALAYTAQIYFDFSGYSDMALGLGRMFGFHFLENFNYPYISKSITEFWRRWHISLSSWFRDYVYIPLGGSRCGKSKQIRNIAVVWLLTGLWHGAAWNFVAWGAWFCVLLLGEKFIWGGLLKGSPSAVKHIYTMLFVVLSWVLFRSDTFAYAFRYTGAMFGIAGGGLADGQSVYYLREYWPEFILAVIASMPVKDFVRDSLQKSVSRVTETLLAWGPRVIAVFLLGLSYMDLVTGSFNPFIYFRF